MTTRGWQYLHYIVLFCIVGVGATAFFQFAGNSSFQLFIGIVTTLAYVGWGIIHHALHGDLHMKVVVEYAVIAIIGIFFLVAVIGS